MKPKLPLLVILMVAILLAAGSYTVTARAINYAPQTVNDVEIVASEVATQDLALRPLAFSVYLPICLRSN